MDRLKELEEVGRLRVHKHELDNVKAELEKKEEDLKRFVEKMFSSQGGESSKNSKSMVLSRRCNRENLALQKA